jgi:bifunctional non-homologous end joining protein LigD
VGAPPEGDEWLHEQKFDGYRIQARRDGDKVVLLSRNGKDWTAALPAIAEAVGRLPCRRVLLDGEAAVLMPDGTTRFNALQNAMDESAGGAITYFVFDLLHLDGFDTTSVPLEGRKAALAELVARAGPSVAPIRYSDHVVGSGADFFQKACGLRLEGIVCKRRRDAYRPGRGRGWLKVKCVNEQELVVAGFTEPEGSRAGIGALLLAVHEGDALRYAGKVGTGFTAKSARDLRARLERLETKRAPFSKLPPGTRRARWVKPELVAQVQFTEWTPDGLLRHPSFKGLRTDKQAADVVRDVEMPPPGRSRRTGVQPEGDGAFHGVRMTHPERVLYPASGLTKRGLAEYYIGIADWILPHVKGRPTSLVRCPEGVGGECFYQKHGTRTAPRELRRVPIKEKKKVDDYLVVDDERGLVALAQMSILEIHTWNSKTDALEQPDRVVFDLDPAEDLPWRRVVEAAFLMRDSLDALGLKSFVQTTGGKGLHVVAPLDRGPSWGDTHAFSRLVAEKIAGARPREYTAVMSKLRRAGRIYIDYQRNQRGATSVCAYSTRAKPDAPVSVPLAWEELKRDDRPSFTVVSLPRRLAKLRQDPWKDYWRTKQRLPGAGR